MFLLRFESMPTGKFWNFHSCDSIWKQFWGTLLIILLSERTYTGFDHAWRQMGHETDSPWHELTHIKVALMLLLLESVWGHRIRLNAKLLQWIFFAHDVRSHWRDNINNKNTVHINQSIPWITFEPNLCLLSVQLIV